MRLVVLAVVSVAAVSRPTSTIPSSSGDGGEAMASVVRTVLEATSHPHCSILLLTHDDATTFTMVKGLKEGQRPRLMVLMTVDQTAGNTTQENMAQLMTMARQVRQSSWCLTVVVTSDDPTFLEMVARVSREVRLLVWSTRLLVVGRAALPEVFSLLHRHWTFSMMNTMFISLNQTYPHPRCGVYVFLPYTTAGPQVAKVAHCSHKAGHLTLFSPTPLYPEKFLNFHGAVVPVTALILPPFWKTVGSDAEGKVIYSGRDYLMMSAVARSLNFTIELRRSFNIDEVLARLEDGRAMIFAFRVMLIPQVLARVDHTYFIDRATFTFTMQKPTITHHWQNLYHPLANQVWVTILVILLLLPGVMYMVVYAGGDVKVRRSLEGQSITLELVGMLVGQELWLGLPRADSARLLVLAWLIFCFILATAYRGNLIAFLTVPKFPARPENMEQLAHTGLRAKFIQNATRFLRYFQESKLSSYKSVGSRADIVVNVMAGLQEISDTRAAFFHERYNTELFIAEHFTSPDGWTPLYVAKENVIPNYAAWMMPHDAPYKANVDRSLLRLIESGLKEKFTDDMMRETWQEIRQRKQQQHWRTISSTSHSNMNLQPLSLTHLQGPYWLLLLGLIVATLAFLGEHIFHASHSEPAQ